MNSSEPMPNDLAGRGLPVPPGGEDIDLGDVGPTGPSSVKSRKQPGTAVYYSHPVLPLAPPGDRITYTIVTGLAAAFNLLVLVVIALVLMPRIETAIQGGDRNIEAIRENRRLLERNAQEVHRLNDLLTDMLKKANGPWEGE